MSAANFEFQGMAPYLSVFDMPVSLKFYRDILSFEVTESSGKGDDVDWVLLKRDNVELMLNTAYEKINRPPSPDASRIAAHNDTILYFGCPHVDELYSHLCNNGINVNKPNITMYGWKALGLKDPDGYGLCFHWPINDV